MSKQIKKIEKPDASNRPLLIALETMLSIEDADTVQDIKDAGIDNTVFFFDKKAYILVEAEHNLA